MSCYAGSWIHVFKHTAHAVNKCEGCLTLHLFHLISASEQMLKLVDMHGQKMKEGIFCLLLPG